MCLAVPDCAIATFGTAKHMKSASTIRMRIATDIASIAANLSITDDIPTKGIHS